MTPRRACSMPGCHRETTRAAAATEQRLRSARVRSRAPRATSRAATPSTHAHAPSSEPIRPHPKIPTPWSRPTSTRDPWCLVTRRQGLQRAPEHPRRCVRRRVARLIDAHPCSTSGRPAPAGFTRACRGSDPLVAPRRNLHHLFVRGVEQPTEPPLGARWPPRDCPHLVDPRTGECTRFELFVMVLGASNLTYAEATMTWDADSRRSPWSRSRGLRGRLEGWNAGELGLAERCRFGERLRRSQQRHGHRGRPSRQLLQQLRRRLLVLTFLPHGAAPYQGEHLADLVRSPRHERGLQQGTFGRIGASAVPLTTSLAVLADTNNDHGKLRCAHLEGAGMPRRGLGPAQGTERGGPP